MGPPVRETVIDLNEPANIIFSLDVPSSADAYADREMTRIHNGLSGTEVVEDVVA
jgi:hypothetical protein